MRRWLVAGLVYSAIAAAIALPLLRAFPSGPPHAARAPRAPPLRRHGYTGALAGPLRRRVDHAVAVERLRDVSRRRAHRGVGDLVRAAAAGVPVDRERLGDRIAAARADAASLRAS